MIVYTTGTRGAMQKFIKHFSREPDGWRCIEPATLDLPSGRIQVTPGSVFVRGTSFMNIDLAQLLDDQHEKDQNRSTMPIAGS